ncbi:hypothetical protein Ddc_17264 [Ditylenchus destructor]|nr:hypothetical protein Ddc_17264 [Ditylenchus destructor]
MKKSKTGEKSKRIRGPSWNRRLQSQPRMAGKVQEFGTPTIEEIVENIRHEEEREDDMIEIQAPEPPAITSQQAQAAFQIARK